MTEQPDALAPRPLGNDVQQAAAKEDAATVPTEVNGVKVIEVAELGGRVTVVLEASGEHAITRLTDYAARNLAYAQRLKIGLGNAGIDAGSGTYIPTEEHTAAKAEDRAVNIWRNDYVLTPGI